MYHVISDHFRQSISKSLAKDAFRIKGLRVKTSESLIQADKKKMRFDTIVLSTQYHIMLCVFAHTLFYAFLIWRKKRNSEQYDMACMRKWRREERIEKVNKILIVAGKYYALFEVGELLDVFDVKQTYRIRMNC